MLCCFCIVESYNPADNEWTLHPSLNKKKGSLAGATLKDKIFAIGGSNGIDCFSEVEMYDPLVERWISTRSMLQKVNFIAPCICMYQYLFVSETTNYIWKDETCLLRWTNLKWWESLFRLKSNFQLARWCVLLWSLLSLLKVVRSQYGIILSLSFIFSYWNLYVLPLGQALSASYYN